MFPKRGRKTAKRDPLDSFVDAAAHALDLKIEPAWKGAIKINLEVTLALARPSDTAAAISLACAQAVSIPAVP